MLAKHVGQQNRSPETNESFLQVPTIVPVEGELSDVDEEIMNHAFVSAPGTTPMPPPSHFPRRARRAPSPESFVEHPSTTSEIVKN